jgi:hypothetical protein
MMDYYPRYKSPTNTLLSHFLIGLFSWLRSPTNYLGSRGISPSFWEPYRYSFLIESPKIVIEPLSLAQELNKFDSTFHIKLGTDTKYILKRYDTRSESKDLAGSKGANFHISGGIHIMRLRGSSPNM